MALAHRLGVNGTPAIIFSNGFKVMGAYPAAQIEQILLKNSVFKKGYFDLILATKVIMRIAG